MFHLGSEIKQQTVSEHSQLENCYPFSRLLQKNVTPNDILQSLKTFYSFFSEPLEYLGLKSDASEQTVYQVKRQLLIDDLIRNNINPHRIGLHHFTKPKSVAEILAWKYVFLSSCFGNGAVAHHLSQNGVNFQSDYFSSKDHLVAWKNLLREFETANEVTARDTIVCTKEIFSSLKSWSVNFDTSAANLS